jgi:2'-5' RNA ligase
LGLRGKFRPREILHVTLHHIDDYAELSERTIETAAEACAVASKSQPALGITFDHVKSFKGRPGNQPFVLVNPNGNESLIDLHHRLITELAKRKLARLGNSKFVPTLRCFTTAKACRNILSRPSPGGHLKWSWFSAISARPSMSGFDPGR